ncbi:MAG TPA: 2,3-bisphosphoglycerate-independent phosphoglycerate mutase [Anaerolineae bacterium]|nr:2,3-bisphosphoglycerate-independent phosphoglycerate mutase [Anaerolineae bacterium]
MSKQYKPVALIILDGWGLRTRDDGNAVALANTPNFDRWQQTVERSVLQASGEAVGLPQDQMGNSEVGHLNLGAGRIIYQDLTRINKAIKDRSFFDMDVLGQAMTTTKQNNNKLHLVGLLGHGGVHSHSRHLFALLELAAQYDLTPIVHVITDGRDTSPQSGADFVAALEAKLEETGGLIADVTGRYHAMDRDKRWPRTEIAYRAITQHKAELSAPSAGAAVQQAYDADVTDEFIKPTIIDCGDQDVTISDGDTVICYNFRADRMRQLVSALTLPDFDGFPRDLIPNLNVLTMTQYEDSYPVTVIFPDEDIVMPLAEVISQQGVTQFHAAETEKYAHVTYFFNGGREQPFPGETRKMAPSPQVATYDLKPEMSAYELTDLVLYRLEAEDDAFVLVNYANPDMVGHTGDLDATIKAVEAVDECVGRLVEAILRQSGVALITADHGNAEVMINPKTNGVHTYHTTNPVTLMAIASDENFVLYPHGILADVAPTILDLLGYPQPDEMTGRSLIDW